MTKGQTRHGRRNNFVMPVALLVMLMLVGQAYWLSRNSHMFAPFAVSQVPCDYCAKLGVIRDEENSRIMKMCPVCFGLGQNAIRRFDENDVVCLACAGMGRFEEAGIWRPCRRCDGRGLHRAGDWKEIIDLEYLNETNNVPSTVEPLNTEP